MTRNQIANLLKGIGSSHRQVRTCEIVEPDYFLDNETKDVVYPAVWFTLGNTSIVDKSKTISVLITIADVIIHPNKLQLEVQSDCELIADDILGQLDWGKQPWTLARNTTYEHFEDNFGDECAGVTFSVELELPFVYDACDLPSNYTLPDGEFVYIPPDRFVTIADFIVSANSLIPTGGSSYYTSLFTYAPFVFINGQLINYEPSANRRYLTFSGNTITIVNGALLEGEHVFIIVENKVTINTSRFMEVIDFIVGAGKPMKEGDTQYQNNLLTVPPFVFIGGQLLGYSNTNDRRYVSHDAITKTITINNGGVADGESVRIVI